MAKENRARIESDEYIHDDNLGQLKIADSVIAVCAINAVLKVSGVAGLTGGITDSIQESLLGRESMSKGVKVDQTEDGINLDIYLVVYYGVKIPEVAWDIQNAVKREVESMTDKKVARVNIHVQGVTTPEKGTQHE
ncbi:MAG: Asp23/Gls24 family envelope stress response protein [Clostridiales bacterium]|nr:Asp23/Gls24 family envelope stress response protein [Clostridiales bacterium]